MGWTDWLAPAGLWAAAPFTGGATIPFAVGATAGAAGKQIAGRGGSGNKGDDDNPESQFISQLQKSGDSLGQTGQQFGDQGQQAMAPVLKQLAAQLGVDPAQLMDATRQERGRVIDQYDTARKAIASFGQRGGGTTSTLAESRFSQAESLADITSNAKTSAMQMSAQLGTQLSALGLNAEQLKQGSLETIIQAIMAREGLDVARRGQNMQAAGDIGETLGTLAGIWMTRDQAAA
jgi:hypothetical protein